MIVGALIAVLAGTAPVVEVQPGAARPGDVVLVTVFHTNAPPEGTLGERSLVFIEDDATGLYRALISLSVEAKPAELKLVVDAKSGDEVFSIEGALEVLPANFPKRELHVSREFTSPSRKQRQQSEADQDAFDHAFDVDFEPLTFARNFAWPRPHDVTAPFGDLRLINGKKKSQHFGMDLDGSTGDPIFAANDGTVVMVRPCFASGNTVLISHGGRLFTSYFHLSRFDVKPGQKVKRGQQLGLVGKTGRVTGPHLHFGVKLDGRWANPESLLALDFERLEAPGAARLPQLTAPSLLP